MEGKLSESEDLRILEVARELKSLGISPLLSVQRMVEAERKVREVIKTVIDTGVPSSEFPRTLPLGWPTFPLRDTEEFRAFWYGIEEALRAEFPALGDDLVFSPTLLDALCRLRQTRAKRGGGRRMNVSEQYRDQNSPVAIRMALDSFRIGDAYLDEDQELLERKLESISKAIALSPSRRGNQPMRDQDAERDYNRHLYRTALERLLRLTDRAIPDQFTDERELRKLVVRAAPLKAFPEYQRDLLAPGLARHLARIRNPRKGERKNYFLRSAVWLLEDIQRRSKKPVVATDRNARRLATAVKSTWKRLTMPEPHRSQFLKEHGLDEGDLKFDL